MWVGTPQIAFGDIDQWHLAAVEAGRLCTVRRVRLRSNVVQVCVMVALESGAPAHWRSADLAHSSEFVALPIGREDGSAGDWAGRDRVPASLLPSDPKPRVSGVLLIFIRFAALARTLSAY